MSNDPLIEMLNTKSGKYLAFNSETWVVNSLKFQGVYQLELISTACDLIEKRGPGVIVDIGAHIGSFSVPVAYTTKCSVVAFEAQRRVAHLLGANYELNNIPNAIVHNVAVSSPEAPETMEIPCIDYEKGGNFGTFSIRQEIRDREVASSLSYLDQTETVDVRTLDSYGLENVALIKVDVEGEELEVFKGAIDTIIMNKRPPIFFECWKHDDFTEKREETIEFVKSLGYQCIFHEDDVVAVSTQMNLK